MKNKLLKILALYGAALTIGIVVQSCCRNQESKICNISFTTAANSSVLTNLNRNFNDGIDTSYNQFGFSIDGQIIDESATCKIAIPFIHSAYAFQPCLPRILDSIPRANINLSLDRDITFNGNVVGAGSNLMTDAIIGSAIDYDYLNYYIFNGSISMDSTNYSQLVLDTGYYEVTLSARSVTGATDIQTRKVLLKEY